MGKNKRAAKAAWRAAARAAPPLHPLVATVTLVDTPPASAVRESPTTTQQLRVSHEADATRASRAAAPAQPTIDASLVLEPAHTNARTATSVAIATPQARAAHALEPCPEPPDSPPALTKPTSTSNDVTPSSHQLPPVSTHADTLIAPHTPIPALSASATTAIAVLAVAIDVLGAPTVLLACPTHSFYRAEDFGHEPDALAPRICPAMTTEEIDEDLLENIIEDAQRLARIEVRREIRLKALEADRERAWKEGVEEGRRFARVEARVEVHQREQAWKDGYEQGRWDGYREGLEIARTEVSTPSSVDASVQADVSIPPHSPPADTVRAPARVDTGVQFDALPLSPPSRAGSPPPIPVDIVPTAPRIHVGVQADAPVSSPPLNTPSTTSRVNAAIQTYDATPTHHRSIEPSPVNPRVDAHVQTDNTPCPHPLPLPFRVNSPPLIPIDMVPATSRVDADVQTDNPTTTDTPRPRIQASTQTDTPRTSAPARARTVQEIEFNLLADILAKASAKGEAKGFTKGKHIGFQDGMEAGWKSGTREGREEGYTDGKKDGIGEGREQYRLEVSRIPRAIAIVQTDYGPPPIHVDSASQTATIAVMRRRPSTHNQFPTTPHSDTNCGPAIITSTPSPTDPHQCTFIPNANGNVHMPHDSFTTMTNTSFMCHNDPSSFSWADDTSLPPVTTKLVPILHVPRDFSVLRSSSHHPFDSLKRRARRSQTQPAHLSRPPRPFILNSEPIVTRRHPAGLRADRPSVVVSSSPSISHPVKLEVPPLDWQGDPRLQELGRVLRGLGWVHGPGS